MRNPLVTRFCLSKWCFSVMTDFYATCFFLCKRHPGDSRIQKPESLNGIKKVALSLEAGGKLDVMGFSGYNGCQSVLERWVKVRADMNKRR